MFGWRSIFLYNVPFGVIGINLCWIVSPPPQEHRKIQIDIIGGVLLLFTVTSFVLAINWARQLGWSSPSVLFLSALFLLSLPGFLLTETLVPHPMLDLALLPLLPWPHPYCKNPLGRKAISLEWQRVIPVLDS